MIKGGAQVEVWAHGHQTPHMNFGTEK